MPQKLKVSYKLNETQLEQLKHIVPEAFKDGMLDFNSLYDALCDLNEEDTIEMDDNFYGLYWPGKRAAKRTASIPPRGTLVPVKGDGVDEENTKNIYIEGDNLEVLKLLQKSYAGKIKMIYIDPPYNMGSDEIYIDDFSESEKSFQYRTGQIDENGIKLTTNSKSDGRFHSNWLSIMYPRLKLSFSLLKDEGIIFISIGEDEAQNLRHICNEIFGEENFIAQIPWRKRTAKSDVPFGISQDYDWILCYAKDEQFSAGIEGGTRRYFETDDLPGRPWRIHDLTTQRTASERPNSFFTLENPKNGKKYPANPNRTWAVTVDTFPEYYKNNRIVFPGDYNFINISKPAFRYFKDEDIKKADGGFGFISVSTQLPDDVGLQEDGTKEIIELFGKKMFSYPKPTNLIKHLIKITTVNDSKSIILDFFSGSATTAHAILKLNAEAGVNHQFIMVQLQESCKEKSEAYNAGFKNICEIGKERIRRAGKKIQEQFQNPQAETHSEERANDNFFPSFASSVPLGDEYSNNSLDIGFKVFRLAPSNFKKWQNYTGTDIKIAEELFSQYENPLVDNWKEEDLLTEIMLAEGFPLDSMATVVKDFKKNKVTQISSDFCEHSLFVCLDNTIYAETIKTLILSEYDIFICLDNAVTDQDKVRLDDKGLIKTI